MEYFKMVALRAYVSARVIILWRMNENYLDNIEDSSDIFPCKWHGNPRQALKRGSYNQASIIDELTALSQ
jgi:hypothetical protein